MKSLQNISYKTLFTILFFSIAGIVFFLKIGSKTQKVSAAWWDEMWHYRKAISITNSSGSDLTDFQVSISIGTSQLIADGKMQTDCDDVRITDINGNLLPYWIEENNPGCNQIADTKIWIKATTLPTSGSTVYLYYGNTSADNNENGDNVFEFFDDFKDATKTNNNWTATGTGFTVTGGSLYHSNTLEPTNSWPTYTINSSSSFTNGIIESRMKPTSCGSSFGKGIIARYTNDNNEYIAGLEAWTGNYTHIGRRVSGTWTNIDQDSLTCSTSTWYQFKWTLNGTSQLLSVNGVASSGVDASFSSGKIGVHVDNKETATGAYWDYIFVHKYASSEPTTSNQSEEIGTGPIAYWKFDEGVGTTAYDSAGNNNGTISEATYANEDQCISGKCLYFDGVNNDYVEFNAPISSGSPFTISMWYFPTRINVAYDILYSGTDNIDLQLFFNTSTKKLNTSIENSEKSTNFTLSSSNINQWYHIVWSYDNSRRKVYVNGNIVADDADTTTFTKNDTRSRIGSLLNGPTYKLQGFIDESKIYPYARTADQIKQDYNSRGSLSGSSVNLGIRSNTAPNITDSLIAYYKFDENNGTTANNSGTLGSTLNSSLTGTTIPTWTNNGKINKALSFTNGYTQSPAATLNSSFTYTVWFNPTSFVDWAAIITNLKHSAPASGLNIIPRSGAIRICYGDGTNGYLYYDVSNSKITTNKWNHAAITYDGTNSTLYLNGQQIDKRTVTIAQSSQSLRIGIWASSYSGYLFNGLIDEVKIYNKALTAEEVKLDYNAGSAIQFGTTTQNIGGTTTSLEYCIPGDTSYCAPPIAEWKMDEGIGTSITDTSGNNNTGTFGAGSSAPTWTQGKIGKGLNFNGVNNYINTGKTIIPTGDFTISNWFKTPDTTGYKTIISQYTSGITGRFWYGMSSNLFGYQISSIPQTVSVEKNKWIFGSITRNGNEMKIYINGQLQNTSTNSDNVLQTNTLIGAYASNAGFFEGQVDQVRIYNYARTPAQIAYDYNKGGPVGWWKFDECQGNIAYDWSGIGNTGVINIGTSGTQNSLGTCAVGTSAAWTNGATGKINSSLNFDGVDDTVNIGSTIPFNTSMSLSAWVLPTSNPSSYGGFLSTENHNTKTGISIWLANNKFYFGQSHNSRQYTDNINRNLNNWYHTTVTYDNGNYSFYLNGNLTKSVTGIGTTLNNTVAIGRLLTSYTAGYYFSGQIDDVRIYNYALTDEQIKQVYNGGAVNFR